MRRGPGFWSGILIVAAFLGLAISGCAQGTPPPAEPPPESPAAPSEPAPQSTPPPLREEEESQPLLEEGIVSFTTEDSVALSGTVFGTGRTAVVLAHMRPVDQTDWHPFAQILADDGFTALTFDFRGYGASGGSSEVGLLHLDVEAALGFLRDAGFDDIFCVGASMGGTACAKAAHAPGLVGLIVISSPTAMEPPLELAPEDFRGLGYPKLFVATESDQPYRDAVQVMYDASPDPKEIQIYSGNAHGTFLFDTEHEEEFRELLIGFLVEHAPHLGSA